MTASVKAGKVCVHTRNSRCLGRTAARDAESRCMRDREHCCADSCVSSGTRAACVHMVAHFVRRMRTWLMLGIRVSVCVFNYAPALLSVKCAHTDCAVLRSSAKGVGAGRGCRCLLCTCMRSERCATSSANAHLSRGHIGTCMLAQN